MKHVRTLAFVASVCAIMGFCGNANAQNRGSSYWYHNSYHYNNSWYNSGGPSYSPPAYYNPPRYYNGAPPVYSGGPGSYYWYSYSYTTPAPAPAPQPAYCPPAPPPPPVWRAGNGHHYMRDSDGNYRYVD